MILLTKPGVQFTTIAPAGFAILAALQQLAASGPDLTITSACDGDHSGLDDPHHKGLAFDVRCHGLPNPSEVLATLLRTLNQAKFFAFIEDSGTPNEHIHIQLRHGVAYP